jgi:hypothetical protein|tara:strand:- start:26 stop:259 length:234 start_codon:yes stop_codon:yes gene_type:complete
MLGSSVAPSKSQYRVRHFGAIFEFHLVEALAAHLMGCPLSMAKHCLLPVFAATLVQSGGSPNGRIASKIKGLAAKSL